MSGSRYAVSDIGWVDQELLQLAHHLIKLVTISVEKARITITETG